MQSSLHANNRKGFTLIELLIVITIVGILAVALVPRITQGPARARDVKRKADLQNIAAALELYYSDNGKYPSASDVFPSESCLNDVSPVTASLSSYLQGGNVPLDQGGLTTDGCSGAYYYAALKANGTSTNHSAYVLASNLETDSPTQNDGVYCGDFKLTAESTSEAVNLLLDGLICSEVSKDAYYVVAR